MTVCCTMPGILMQTCFFFFKYYAHSAFYISNALLYLHICPEKPTTATLELNFERNSKSSEIKLKILIKIKLCYIQKKRNYIVWIVNKIKDKCNEQKWIYRYVHKNININKNYISSLQCAGFDMYSTSSVWILNLECKVIRKKYQKLFLKHSLNLKMKHLVLFLQYF